MNRIVRDRYPVDRLPDEIRDGLPIGAEIRLEIEVKATAPRPLRLADMVGSLPNVHGSEQEVLDHIRALRDEE